jgi:HAD superfamily hydrolase (TIGR01509 family)
VELRTVSAVVFDVGETLVDETAYWQEVADHAGVPRFTLFGLVGGLAGRGLDHRQAFELLGVEAPSIEPTLALYPDAVGCLERLRAAGRRVGAVGNMPESLEQPLRPFVDWTGSSRRWGVAKPSPVFFERVAEEAGVPAAEIAYVGDRVDNDVRPAKRAGMLAVHLRRGPWGYLQDASEADIRIDSLDQLPEALGV